MSDAWTPAEVAARVLAAGQARAAAPLTTMFPLALLAGAFIGFGAQFALVALTGTEGLGFGLRQVLAGGVFGVGLMLVVVAGAELFTGDNLLVIAWAAGRLSTRRLLHTWLVVLAGNAVGAAGLAALVAASAPNEAVVKTVLAVATTKAALPFGVAFARGVLCNVLVCLAVWSTASCRGTGEKILALAGPIAAFVAAGFEHSVANLYIFPLAALLGPLDVGGALHNLGAVILGNLVGGGGFVAGIYWWIYLRPGLAKG